VTTLSPKPGGVRNELPEHHSGQRAATVRNRTLSDDIVRLVHPIEQLRYVARAGSPDSSFLVQEAAMALSSFGRDPAALLTAARRLLDRQPALAPLWWMASRLVIAPEPAAQARTIIDLVQRDPTKDQLVAHIPPSSVVAISGAPETILDAIESRGDIMVLVIDVDGLGPVVARRLDRAEVAVECLDASRIGGAVSEADLVLVDAASIGPSACLVEPGVVPLAATAKVMGCDLWLVADIGRVLPEAYWRQIVARTVDADRDLEVWLQDWEVLSHGLVSGVITAQGLVSPSDIGPFDSVMAPELLAAS